MYLPAGRASKRFNGEKGAVLTSCSASMSAGNNHGLFNRRTSSQPISSQNSNRPFGNKESECSFMSSGGCFEKLGELLGVSSFDSDREAINENSLFSSQERPNYKVEKSHSVDPSTTALNQEKLNAENFPIEKHAENSPKTLLSYLGKFSYKPSGEAKKTESSPKSPKRKDNITREGFSSVVPNQTDDKKKNKEISKLTLESALDDCEAAFDIDFDDDCQEMFDCDFEERTTNDSNNPMKDQTTDENISDGSLEKLLGDKCGKEFHDGSTEAKRLLQKFGKRDSDCNNLINTSACSTIEKNIWSCKKNEDIVQGTLKSSNKTSRNSVSEIFTPTAMTKLLLSPASITSEGSSVQRYCSSPVERREKLPSVLENCSPSLSSPIVRSFDAKSIEKNVGKFRKRKFPGPAGMLPDIPPGTNLSLLKQTEFTNMSISSDCSFEKEICSQSTLEHFEKLPWQSMLKDLETYADSSLLKRFNIRLALWKASKKRLPKHIVFPVMCVLLSDITFNSNEADAVFKDETGEITGKVCVEVIEKYKEYMVPFSALIIKRAEFLCNQLIVKLVNVAAIYSANGKNLRLQESLTENIQMFENSNTRSREKHIVEHSEQQNPDITLDDDYESFFADDMDDLLNSMDNDTSAHF